MNVLPYGWLHTLWEQMRIVEIDGPSDEPNVISLSNVHWVKKTNFFSDFFLFYMQWLYNVTFLMFQFT